MRAVPYPKIFRKGNLPPLFLQYFSLAQKLFIFKDFVLENFFRFSNFGFLGAMGKVVVDQRPISPRLNL